jgi:hypothetical protein
MRLPTKLCFRNRKNSITIVVKLKNYKGLELILKTVSLISGLIILIPVSADARIVNRKVKEAPRVCAPMKEDSYLSRDGKRIFGTLRNSVIIEDEIFVVNDLGKKICQWPLDKLSQFAEPLNFNFYIDEYKNKLYPHIKKENGFLVMSVDLADCSMQDTSYLEKLDFPKCVKPTKKKVRKRKRS